MHFTDIFIKRPVLATVISLAILLLGLRAGFSLNVQQYPHLQNAQISISVAYPGADSALVDGFITTPLEREIATADGIDFLSSSSGQGFSSINANLRLDKDPNEALTEISAKVNKLRNQLPEGSEDPVIQLSEAASTAAMYMSFYSEVLSGSQITDYITRVVEPQFSAIPGVERAEVFGGSPFAMRIWLDPDRMAANNLTASEVFARIRAQNVLSPVGETKGNYIRMGLSADTNLRTAEEFQRLVVKQEGEAVVRLGDIARVHLGAESYDNSAGWDAKPAVFIGLRVRPDANVLDVLEEVRRIWPSVERALPEGLEGEIGYDSSLYIRDAIREVVKTLAEAMLVVIVVIFLFLGSVRSALIPAVTVPLSLVGALFLMLLLGFTINLLTLLAMVLAIGMVVDDAIIVMENVHRHIEEGMRPLDASLKGARELVGPVIAMTATLVAVYAPIGFLTGITGTLFTEFAFTLAGAVLISGVVALTLTPMMCSRILKPQHGPNAEHNRLAEFLDRKFEQWRQGYKRRLHGALNTAPVIGVFGLVVLVSCFFLFRASPSELAPAEDMGLAMTVVELDGYSSPEYLNRYFLEAQKTALAVPEIAHIFSFAIGQMGTNQGFIGEVLKPWSERERSLSEVVPDLTQRLQAIPGARIAVIQPPPLPTPGEGYPVQFVLKATTDPETLARVGDEVVARALATKKFFFAAPMLRIDRPEARIEIDRDRAAMLGIDMQRLSADLAALFAGAQIDRFDYQSRSYRVIQQVERAGRLNPRQLEGFYTRAQNGELVPIASVVRIVERTVPRSILHVQQMPSNTIIAVPRPDVTQGEALATLESIAAEVAPPGFQFDYAGVSRQYKQEGSALMLTFAFALIFIYLVLAAQFESFRDPLIMLVTVPMSICGALLFLNIFGITNSLKLTNFPGMTLNIYTQVGLVTLIGVISKHGILIVEFANKLQLQGYGKREAIEEAASIRLRPVLMTTAALVIGVFPLLLAVGPGAASRFSMGMVIATGMSVGTLFTLYVVPAAYMYIGQDLSAKREARAAAAGLDPAS